MCGDGERVSTKSQCRRQGGDSLGIVPRNPKSWHKLSKKNCMKSVGYTFRLKNYVKLQILAAVSLFDPNPQISLQLLAQASNCCSDSTDDAPCTSSPVKFVVFCQGQFYGEWAGMEIFT